MSIIFHFHFYSKCVWLHSTHGTFELKTGINIFQPFLLLYMKLSKISQGLPGLGGNKPCSRQTQRLYIFFSNIFINFAAVKYFVRFVSRQIRDVLQWMCTNNLWVKGPLHTQWQINEMGFTPNLHKTNRIWIGPVAVVWLHNRQMFWHSQYFLACLPVFVMPVKHL